MSQIVKEFLKPQRQKEKDALRGKDGTDGASIRGDKGERGVDGVSIRGDKGERGERGSDGTHGKMGARGERGFTGDKGDQGVQGLPGDKGTDGRHGKDGRVVNGGGGGALIAAKQFTTDNFVPYTGATKVLDMGSFSNDSLNNFLPNQTSNAGKFLQTNGSDTSWVAGATFNTIEEDFTSQTSITVTHNNGYRPPVFITNTSNEEIIPDEITHTSVNAFTVTFTSSKTGTIIYGSSGFVNSPLGNFVDIDFSDSPYDVIGTEAGISVDAAANNPGNDTVVINLLLKSAAPVRRLNIQKNEASANTVTVNRAGSDLIRGATSKVLASFNEGYDFTPYPTEWRLL